MPRPKKKTWVKSKQIIRVAPPIDKITGADFRALKKKKKKKKK